MPRSSLPLVAAAFLLLGAGEAAAVPVTENFAVNASGFSDVTGATTTVPVDPVTLTVSLTFDPATGDQFDNSAGVRLLGTNLPVTALSFDYDSVNDTLTFGGPGLSDIAVVAGTNDVLFAITSAYRGPASFGGLFYTTSTSPGIFESFTGTVGVPEPASALLLLGGLGGMALRRRRA